MQVKIRIYYLKEGELQSHRLYGNTTDRKHRRSKASLGNNPELSKERGGGLIFFNASK